MHACILCILVLFCNVCAFVTHSIKKLLTYLLTHNHKYSQQNGQYQLEINTTQLNIQIDKQQFKKHKHSRLLQRD